MPTTQRLKDALIAWEEAERAKEAANELFWKARTCLQAEAMKGVEFPCVFTLPNGTSVRLDMTSSSYSCHGTPEGVIVERLGRHEQLEAS